MESLDNMLNIGKEMKRKLFSIGVRSSEDLIRLGSKEVFSQLKEQYPNAIDNVDYDKLPDEVKRDLKQFHDRIKDK